MMSFHTLARCAATAAALLLVNCAHQQPAAQIGQNGKAINPYPPGSYAHFKAEPSYPKTYNVWTNNQLFASTGPDNSHLRIDLASQRGLLMNGSEVVLDYPICSGIPTRPTPTGTFYILEKVIDKKSNRYGRFYDAAGEMVNGNADAILDPLPAGGRFEGAEMHYWMRLTYDGVGHHIGPVRRYPASHACVRGPSQTIPIVYDKVKEGTRVDIE
ncbi:MAG: L,D-transpeptidase [Verrucomicrobiota bacterium]